MVSHGCRLSFPVDLVQGSKVFLISLFCYFFPHVEITHFDEITYNLNTLTLQMDDTEMSEELRCTAWCHIHHLPLCDRASGPEWERFLNLLLMSLLLQVLQNLTPCFQWFFVFFPNSAMFWDRMLQ